MSAAFFDYDNDGRLDIYTGNMWSAAGLRVTALPGFKPDAPAEVREIYKRHARGNSLFRNKGDGTFEDVTLRARRGDGEVGVVFGRARLRPRRLRGRLRRQRHVHAGARRERTSTSTASSGGRSRPGRRSTLRRGTPFDDAWRATNRLLAENGSQARHERNVFLRNDGQGGFDDVSGSVGLDLDQDGRSFAVLDYDQDGDPDLAVMAARAAPQLRLLPQRLSERERAPWPSASWARRAIATPWARGSPWRPTGCG